MSESEEPESIDPYSDPVSFLVQVSEVQHQLRADFERLAANVAPLLTRQYRETERGCGCWKRACAIARNAR